MPYKVLNIKQLFIHIYWTVLIKTNKATLIVGNYFHQALTLEVFNLKVQCTLVHSTTVQYPQLALGLVSS